MPWFDSAGLHTASFNHLLYSAGVGFHTAMYVVVRFYNPASLNTDTLCITAIGKIYGWCFCAFTSKSNKVLDLDMPIINCQTNGR